jgi:hypothetical protein
MKEPALDSAPDFQYFKEVMRGMLKVPKTRLDELVEKAESESPRVGNSRAPGRKSARIRSLPGGPWQRRSKHTELES